MTSDSNAILRSSDRDSSQSYVNGDPSLGYPQIVIRTDLPAKKTDLNPIIKALDEVAANYPDDKEKRGMAVLEKLNDMLGSKLGHSWIIIFHSKAEDDYSSYAYHEGYGYVHNGDTRGETNDTPAREFTYQRILPINLAKIPILENCTIPYLNFSAEKIGEMLKTEPAHGRSGVYNGLTNCSWFAGRLWSRVMETDLPFVQKFDGAAYAERWGLDILYIIRGIAEPGIIAESIAAKSH